MSEAPDSMLAFLIQLLPLTILMLFVAIPMARILRRMGYSRAWALLWLIPLVNIVALWILAFSKWPREAEETAKVFK